MANPERGEASEALSPLHRIWEAKERIEKEGKALEWGEFRELRREDEARLTGKNLGIALDIVGPLEALTQFAENNPLSIEAFHIANLFYDYERDMEYLQGSAKGDSRARNNKVIQDMAKMEEKMRDLVKKLLPPQE